MKKILLTIFIIIMVLSVNVIAVDIDIGNAATDRSAAAPAGYTLIDQCNPANASGKITSIEIWTFNDLINCEVAIFYAVDETHFTTRDNATLGTVTHGSKQTFEVDLDVMEGDYIGIYYSTGDMERDNSGTGYQYILGDSIPCTNTAFAFTANRTISLYGTGATVGWSHKWNTQTISKWNTKEFTKWNGLE